MTAVNEWKGPLGRGNQDERRVDGESETNDALPDEGAGVNSHGLTTSVGLEVVHLETVEHVVREMLDRLRVERGEGRTERALFQVRSLRVCLRNGGSVRGNHLAINTRRAERTCLSGVAVSASRGQPDVKRRRVGLGATTSVFGCRGVVQYVLVDSGSTSFRLESSGCGTRERKRERGRVDALETRRALAIRSTPLRLARYQSNVHRASTFRKRCSRCRVLLLSLLPVAIVHQKISIILRLSAKPFALGAGPRAKLILDKYNTSLIRFISSSTPSPTPRRPPLPRST